MSSPQPAKAYLGNTLKHFRTFVWLRWRIRVNQLRHSSGIGKALAAILLVSFAMSCVALLVTGIVLGIILPRLIPRENYFLFWDGLIALFCFIWMIFVATDAQRTDAITFDRILHLPVSFSQAFAINYLSSLINLPLMSLCTFTFGFILGSCFSIGPIALLFAVPFCVFLIAITALTYQFQGWLAAIMANPRRRQLVMIAIPLCIIIISQLPTYIAMRFAREDEKRARSQQADKVSEPSPVEPSPVSELPTNRTEVGAIATGTLEKTDGEQSNQGNTEEENRPEVPVQAVAVDLASSGNAGISDELKTSQEKERKELRARERAAAAARWMERLSQANLYFPPLWVAGCIESLMAGTLHFLWLTSGLALIAFVSLRRNYRQTLRFYKGETDSRSAMSIRASATASDQEKTLAVRLTAVKDRRRLLLVERRFPLVSEETSAIIAMTLKSMTRAPEVKLYLLLPFIVPFLLFGVLQAWELPKIDELKAAIVVGFSACCLFISSGMLGNLFAFDRAGFRAFVLSPVPRHRILLGRNLATVPFLFLQTILMALAIGIYFGISIDKFLSAILLSACILPPFCLLTNVMAIVTPFPLAAGSVQPKQFNLLPILFSLALSMLMPAMTGLALMPLGVEWLLDRFIKSTTFVPFAFLLSIPWLMGSLFLYRWLLPWEGKLLANREKELLRIVTSKIE